MVANDKKRIDLWAPPFSGHLNPILALGRQLNDRFEVRVVTTASVQAKVEAAGLGAVAVLQPEDEVALEAVVSSPRAIGSHPSRLFQQFQGASRLMARLAQATEELYRDRQPDLMIADFTLGVAGLTAQRLGIPWWTLHGSPCAIETSDGPPGYLGGWGPARHGGDALLHAGGRLLVHGFKSAVFHLTRATLRPLGIPDLYRPDGTEVLYSDEKILVPCLEGLEFRRTWPRSLIFIAPLLYTPPVATAPPFRRGRRHVLVTAGTHLSWYKERLAEAARDLARKNPEWEIHMNDGNPGAEGLVQGNFTRIPFVHYDRYLGQYDLVVHHAGAGVLYHCLRTGVPSVVLPVDYDQFDNAARLEFARASVWVRHWRDLPGTVRDVLSGRRSLPGVQRLKREMDEQEPDRVVGIISRFLDEASPKARN